MTQMDLLLGKMINLAVYPRTPHLSTIRTMVTFLRQRPSMGTVHGGSLQNSQVILGLSSVRHGAEFLAKSLSLFLPVSSLDLPPSMYLWIRVMLQEKYVYLTCPLTSDLDFEILIFWWLEIAIYLSHVKTIKECSSMRMIVGCPPHIQNIWCL